MGERTKYTPGTFSWVELATTDQEAAKTFYGGLFGWGGDDLPIGDGVFYSMMSVGGKPVAAIAPQPQVQRDAGVPPVWQSFVTVESADATAARVQELGGTVHAGPFDVMEAGRMAVIQDPQGAFFNIWEPGANHGAALVNEPGALVWNELESPDLDAATAFYSGLFGWTVAPFEDSAEPYLAIRNGEANNGGMRGPSGPSAAPSHWLVYFGIGDIDAGLAKVSELGGTLLAGPIDIQIAKIGVVADPQGAVFALYSGEMEP